MRIEEIGNDTVNLGVIDGISPQTQFPDATRLQETWRVKRWLKSVFLGT